jgi:hypothetical protein
LLVKSVPQGLIVPHLAAWSLVQEALSRGHFEVWYGRGSFFLSCGWSWMLECRVTVTEGTAKAPALFDLHMGWSSAGRWMDSIMICSNSTNYIQKGDSHWERLPAL